MPHVIVKLYPGRDEERKAEMAEAVAQAVERVLGCERAALSVAVEEVQQAEWAERVYRPDILDREDTLYVKPGYNPFSQQFSD